MRHHESSELIVGYVAGTLDSQIAAAFQRHIESCPACCAAVAGQKAVWAALDEDLWRRPAVSPDFDQKLFERISASQKRRWWTWRALAAVVSASSGSAS